MTDGVSDSEVLDQVLTAARELLGETGPRPELPEGGVHDHEIATRSGQSLGIVQAALLTLAPDQLQVQTREDGPWTVRAVDPSAH